MKHIGEYLKQRRCEKNITLEEVASQTGIREQYLTALESGDFEKIPGDVFIKGFIRNYGNFLEENGNDLVEAYTKGLATPEALHEPLKAAPSDVKEQPEVLQEPASSPASTADATPENDEERTMVVTPSMMEEARRSWEEEEAFEEEQEKTTPKVQAVIKEIDDEPEPDENQKEESGIVKKLRHFIESILYEEVDEDDDEDDDADDEALENGEDRQESPLYAYQKKERQDNRKGVSAYLNIRIFGIVFAIFFGIFCVVMAYFLFGGKTMPEIPATTSLSDSVKSENSSTRKAEEAKKEEKQPETKEEKKGDTLLPVVRFSFPPQRCVVQDAEGYLKFKWPEYRNSRSQDLEPYYHDAGQFYCLRVSSFLAQQNLIMEKTVPMELPETEVQDIDNEEDWKLAEMKYHMLGKA